MPTQLLLVLFPLIMAFAASSDLLTMRISNRVSLLLAALFVVAAVVSGMSLQDFGLHMACAAVVLVVAFGMFAMGWIGGGDAKLAAATSLWMGFALTLPYLVYASLIGGLMTLLIMGARNWPLPLFMTKIGWIERLHNPKTGIPYGIALAIAGLLTYTDTSVFQHLAA
jgi:prepilin peptidase CpaA